MYSEIGQYVGVNDNRGPAHRAGCAFINRPRFAPLVHIQATRVRLVEPEHPASAAGVQDWRKGRTRMWKRFATAHASPWFQTCLLCQLFLKDPQSFYDNYLELATIIVDGVEQRTKTSIVTECKRLGIKPPTDSVVHDFYYNTNVTWENHTFQYLEEPNQFFDVASKPRTIKVRKTLFQRIFK